MSFALVCGREVAECLQTLIMNVLRVDVCPLLINLRVPSLIFSSLLVLDALQKCHASGHAVVKSDEIKE